MFKYNSTEYLFKLVLQVIYLNIVLQDIYLKLVLQGNYLNIILQDIYLNIFLQGNYLKLVLQDIYLKLILKILFKYNSPRYNLKLSYEDIFKNILKN